MTKLIHYVEEGDEYVGDFDKVSENIPDKHWKTSLKFFKKALCSARSLRQLIDEIAERPSLCCTLHKPTYNFEVAAGATTTIPFQEAYVYHDDLPFADGVITPQKEGWYSVFAYCYDGYPNGANTYNLHIVGGGSIGIVDLHVATAPPFKLLGRQSVYCNGTTDTISAALSHTAGGALNFNKLIGGVHKSYLNVNYIGTKPSGNIIET